MKLLTVLMFTAPMLSAQAQGFPQLQQCGSTPLINACVSIQLIPQLFGVATRQASVSIVTTDTQVAAYAVVVQFELLDGSTLALKGIVTASAEYGVTTTLNFPIHGVYPAKVTKFYVVRMYPQPADYLIQGAVQ
jgi:hypothetical protein